MSDKPGLLPDGNYEPVASVDWDRAEKAAREYCGNYGYQQEPMKLTRIIYNLIAERASALPAGSVVVPREPTEAMMADGVAANVAHDQLYPLDGMRRSKRVWQAMLSAAPRKE